MAGCGVHVDGIIIPGFSSLKEAEDAIRLKPGWQNKGAVAIRLRCPAEKGTFSSDFPPPGTARLKSRE